MIFLHYVKPFLKYFFKKMQKNDGIFIDFLHQYSFLCKPNNLYIHLCISFGSEIKIKIQPIY
jgi:hypothetical protein